MPSASARLLTRLRGFRERKFRDDQVISPTRSNKIHNYLLTAGVTEDGEPV
jgi:hypothetical protein